MRYWIEIYFRWIKSVIERIFKMKIGSNAAGKFSSKKVVSIHKFVELDQNGNEIYGTAVFKVVDSYGVVLKEATNIIEIHFGLDEHKNTIEFKS